MNEPAYNPIRCDLCSSQEYSGLLQINTGQAMRSDRGIISCNLSKFSCARCGLVRSEQHFESQVLQDYYAHNYRLSVQPEHYFYTPQGSISRSKILCDWLVSTLGTHRWQVTSRCLEIGAGAGLLLQEFVQRFPQTRFEGIELNEAAVNLAQQQGLAVRQGALSDYGNEKYDLIYAVAVIEHVPSPTTFLAEIHRHLKPGGWLILCQPTQDVPSYDLFFFDHLHHFGSEHLRQYARKCGFWEMDFVVGHEWMPNFSLHVWQATTPPADFTWIGPPSHTTCPAMAHRIMNDMARLDETLARLAAAQRRVAVFGLNEVYWLARTYSELGNFPLICGLDDQPDKPEFVHLEFSVLMPEEGLSLGIQDVLLTMNKIYYPQASQRLERLGLAAHPVLT